MIGCIAGHLQLILLNLQTVLLMPVITAGAFVVLLLANMLFYSKATALQAIKLSLASLVFAMLTASISAVTAKVLSHHSLTAEGINLAINPAWLVSCLLFGFLSVKAAVSFEAKKTLKQVPTETSNSKAANIPVEQSEVKPIQQKTQVVKKEPVMAPAQPAFEKPVEQIALVREEPVATISMDTEVFEQNFDMSVDSISKVPELVELEALPELHIFEQDFSQEDTAHKSTAEKPAQSENNYNNFAAKDRIINATTRKSVDENKGKIASIGKLLINTRDIENLIQMNENSEDIISKSENTQVVSFDLGLKIYEKFNKILVDYRQIKNLSFIDKNGAVIASTYRDNHQRKLAGAIVSCVYGIAQNYFEQLGITNFSKIIFETESSTDCLFEVDGKILYLDANKDFESVNFNHMSDILNQSIISNQDFSAVKNKKGIIEALITSEDGSLLGHFNSENPEQYAKVLSAVFENLKYFITSLHSYNLDKISLFTDNRVIIIRKYTDKIAVFVQESPGLVTLSNNMQSIDTLIKGGNA